MITYPSSLPRPVRDEYNKTATHKTRRIVMEDGFVRPQVVVTAPQYARTLRWNLKHHQIKTFKDWWVRLGGAEVEIPLEEGVTAVITVAGVSPTYEPTPLGMVARLQVLEIKEPVGRIVGFPSWPSTLPTFNTQGASMASGIRYETGDADVFQPASRQRFSSTPGTLAGTLTLNLAERNDFWAFYEGIGMGGRYFNMPLFDGVTQRNVRAWLMDEPREVANGPGFDVSISIGYNATTLVKSGL